jgi:hypothetical protein
MTMVEQLPALHETIFEMMLKARWVKFYTFTDGGGCRLAWTTGGAQRAMILKAIILSYDLYDEDYAPVAFTIMSRSGDLNGMAETAHPELLAFWRDCCDEIGLKSLMDDCLAFVQIVCHFHQNT